MTGSVRVCADGGGTGVAVPLPRDWPDGGGSPTTLRTEPRVLRDVAARIRAVAADNSPAVGAYGRGMPRGLGVEPGTWATGRSVQHLHSQLREAVTAFRGALVAGLPAVAARLEESAARYDRAELANAREIDRTAGGLGDRPAAGAPSVVGPDGRF